MSSLPFLVHVQPSDLVTIGLLVALEGLLSADNAMVLAVLVLGLPRKEQQKALLDQAFAKLKGFVLTK